MSRQRNDSIAKEGRKGAGIQGSITPGQRHKANKPPQAAEDLGIREVISPDEVLQAVSDIEYDLQNKELIVTKSPVSGGGGGGTSFSTAVVLGGNATQSVEPFDPSKPSIYNLARFPTPVDPANAVDWTKLDLPLSFMHGDVIPAAPDTLTHSWPHGVGLARLTRGSADVGGSAWDADLDPVDPLANVAARPHYFFTKRGFDPTKLYCYFDKASISAADYTKITVNLGYTVTAAAVSGPVITLTVSPSINGGDVATGLTVQFLSKALVVCTDASSGNDVYLSPQTVNVSQIDNDSPIAVDDVAIRGAVIEPAALNKIKVWMSGPINSTASTSGWTITGGSPALSLSSATVTDATGGVILLTLNRAITAADLSGDIQIAHTAAITTQTAQQTASPANIPSGPCAAGGPLSAIYKAARSCYVLVINRYTEKDYSEGDLIDISPTAFVDLEDANGVVRRCYDSRLREAVEVTYVGRIIGGNMTTGVSPLPCIKYVEYSAPVVATPIDPYADPNNLADGVGYAYLYRNGVLQFVDLGAGLVPQRVLIQHFQDFFPFALIKEEFVLLGNLVRIDGAGNNNAYTVAGF